MMRAAPRDRIGLALGAWGAAQACAAGIGVALAGIVRDVIVGLQSETGTDVHLPYNVVFTIEALSLIAAIAVILPLAWHTKKRIDLSNSNTEGVKAS